MRWLRKMVIAFGRWWVRQTAVSLVIMLGILIGWWVRKGTGPRVLSESFSRANASSPVPPRPGPLTPRDPAVAGYLAEFASLEGPSGTLLRLQADLERGRITDFESLAKSLLSHPLRHFREEAMRSVLAAWGRKDAGAALQFIDDYGRGYIRPAQDGTTIEIKNRIALEWAQRDPAAALDFLNQSSRDGGLASDIIAGVLSKGQAVERLRLLTDKLGEITVGSCLQRYFELIRSRPPAQLPSSAEWQALAAATRSAPLAARYASEALIQKFREAKIPPSEAEAGAWLAEIVPPGLRTQINWQTVPPGMMATLLPALSVEELRVGNSSWALASLHAEHPEAVLGFFQANGTGGIPPRVFSFLGGSLYRRPDAEWVAMVAAATEPAQREALGGGLVSDALNHRGRVDPLGPLVERVAGLGRDGEPAMAILLGGLRGETAKQVPELFAKQSPDFQAQRRTQIVAHLVRGAAPVAAELWLGASPEELVEPGAAAVTEAIAARYLAQGSEAASDWIGRLPPGIGRDRAVARMIETTATRDPATCAQWAATIQDPAALERATAALGAGSDRRSPSGTQ